MRDFLRFLRQLLLILHFLRGILFTFLLLLIICVVVIAFAEGMPIRQAIYFVLVTALTIGYGDVTAATMLGRMASVAAGILGVLANGIVVAVAVRALVVSMDPNREEQNPRK